MGINQSELVLTFESVILVRIRILVKNKDIYSR